MSEQKSDGYLINIGSLLGLTLSLFSLTSFFSLTKGIADGPVSFIFTLAFSYWVIYIFGIVAYWFLLPFFFMLGICIIFRKRINIYNKKLILGGFFVLIFGFIMLFSSVELHGLVKSGIIDKVKITDTKDVFNNIFKNDVWEQRFDVSIISQKKLGGGIVGFFLSSILSSVGYWFALVISILILCTGFVMIFNEPIGLIFGVVRTNNELKKKEDDYYKEITNNIDEETDDNEEIHFVDNTSGLYEQTSKPSNQFLDESTNHVYYGSRSNQSVKKAVFLFAEDDESLNSNKPVKEENQIKLAADIFDEEEEAKTEFEQPKEALIEEEIPAPVVAIREGQVKKEVVEKVEIDESLREEILNEDPEVYVNQFGEADIIEGKSIVVNPKDKQKVKHCYTYPSTDLLNTYNDKVEENMAINEEKCVERIDKINKFFQTQRVEADVVSYTIGTSITRFDVQYRENGLSQQVEKIVQDISIRLGGVPTRFEPLVLGKDTSGLEIANAVRMTVGLKECIENLPERTESNATMFCFGKDISAKYINAKIAKCPHMLVAGTTGSGKSVFVHSIIVTLIMRNSPDELRLVMIDPKTVEMTRYIDLPHLLCPIITEPAKALTALNKLVKLMDDRYREFRAKGVSNIIPYNEKAKKEGFPIMPNIICFIDEFADLMDNCKDVTKPVAMLGQKSRACGIHIVLATQRPTVDIVSGTIKANMPVRVALNVQSAKDSVCILDKGGAESLLGNGDMLLSCGEVCPNALVRCQGAFIDDSEIDRVVDFIKSQWEVEYDEDFSNLDNEENSAEALFNERSAASCAPQPSFDRAELAKLEEEELYKKVKAVAMGKEYYSMSAMQRDFPIGFNKAGRLFKRLIEERIVAATSSSRGSMVLVHEDPSDSINEPTESNT